MMVVGVVDASEKVRWDVGNDIRVVDHSVAVVQLKL